MKLLREDSVFRNKNFVLLWFGQLVSLFGNRFHEIAVMWYVLQVTGSGLKMGTTLIFSLLPQIFLGPIAGSFADRWDRKKMIVISDLLNGVLVGVIAILMFAGKLQLWHLYSITALMSVAKSFFNPAISATIPTIVKKEKLIKANSYSQISMNASNIFGPILGGIFVAVIGIPGLFLLDSISYIASGISESFMFVPKLKLDKTKKHSVKKDIKEGFMFALKTQPLFHLLIVGGVVLNFLFAPFAIYAPIFSQQVLGLDSSGYGFLMSGIAVGSLLMAFAMPLVKKVGYYRLVFIAFVLEGLTIIPLAFVNSLPAAYITLIAVGASVCVANVSIMTIFQTVVPNNLMGRVGSIFGLLCNVTMPFGYFVGGLLVDTISFKSLFIMTGILGTIAGLSTISIFPKIRKGEIAELK